MMRTMLLAFGMVVLSSAAQAAVVLTLDTDPAVSFEQTLNRPCVIGDPSCANPGSFPSTTLAPAQSTYTNVLSPLYTVDQIRAIVGNAFFVGIDVNSQGNQAPLATEVLDAFSLSISGVQEFLFNTSIQLGMANPGLGFSDDLLSGFDLTSFSGSASAQFSVTYHNATAGRDQFFLVAAPVPEPGTLALLGLAVVALGLRYGKTR